LNAARSTAETLSALPCESCVAPHTPLARLFNDAGFFCAVIRL
jgi:hypothetical protein